MKTFACLPLWGCLFTFYLTNLFHKILAMKTLLILACFQLFICQISCQQNTSPTSSKGQTTAEKNVGGTCECCEAWKDGIPQEIGNHAVISPSGEKGEPLEISGTIFQNDGVTPAEGVILYLYHTDAEGLYSRGSGTACARRHGLLRAWVKTGKDGKYSFRTIRPASYPNTSIEQHIHATIKEPGYKEYWITEYQFDDDPNLSEEMRHNSTPRGGSGILTLIRTAEGVWTGTRDIILGLNVTDYP